MKIISLNVWGGRVHAELTHFLKSKQDSIDIFCFQEMYHQADGKFSNVEWKDDGIHNQLFDYVAQLLPNHVGIFYPHFEDFWGLAMFVKKNIQIIAEGEKLVHQTESIEEARRGGTSKNIQYVLTEINSKKVSIVNFHGLWNGKGKTDSESRVAQSRKIVEFLKSLEGEVVLCGDFNLRPDTESLKIVEDFGFRNLVKEYGITSTRTSHYKKEERFADYALITKGVEVKDFKILPEEVSDHNAMYLEFSLS